MRGILVTFNGEPEILNLDMITRITKDPDSVQAIFHTGNGLSRRCDQDFQFLVEELQARDIIVPIARKV